MFIPIETKRLLIRPMLPADAAGLAARRSEPEVALYQAWSTPYALECAESLVSEVVAMSGPENDQWWMASVCSRETDEVLGDLVVRLSHKARTAEVGYTFASRNWGHGYASEALEALVAYLFNDLHVTRIFGMLHPDNPASAMVLEHCGFLHEGQTLSSFWLNEVVSDDLIYGLTRPDWEKWVGRPRTRPESVTLVEIDHTNEAAVWRMRTHESQKRFVAPMEWSYIDFLFPFDEDKGVPMVPWMRGVKADDVYVGFVMLGLASEHQDDPYLWRLLIDKFHQRRGIASQILELVAIECRQMGATSLVTSWVEGKGSPGPFYEARGFVPTGEIVDEETEARKALT